MAKQINISDSITLVPSGYDDSNSSYSSISSSYPITNAYDSSNSTNYAYITCNTGSAAITKIQLTFNVSDVPAEATIDSVECVAKLRVSSTSYISTAVAQIYCGSTAKGSSVSACTTTATNYTITTTDITRNELDNIGIRYTGTRGTSNTTRAAYLYFYGADLTINYSISGTAYTITATSTIQDIDISPATQDIIAGKDAVIYIDTDDITDYIVTDNEIDVTEDLIKISKSTSGSDSNVLGTYTLVSGSFNSSSTYFSRIVGNGVDAADVSTNVYSGGSGTIAVFTYDMSFDNIPSNAVITRLYCQVRGHAESSSNSNEYMCAQLISDSIEITEEYNFKTSGTSNITYTLEATDTVTIAQLAQLKLQCRVGYYGGAISGATCFVEYNIPSNDYQYKYELSNLAADHVILLDLAGVFIPPEEDPEETYHSITISSINATTNPRTGTTRVVEGSNQTITISPSDPQLTLALDNGVDITSQLQGGVPNNTYTVDTQVSGASYGFTLNSSTGYYVSSNGGVSSSASVARLHLNCESDVLLTIQYINYGESGYDYGLFGKLDTTIATDGLTAASGSSSPSDSTNNYQYICSSSSDSTSTEKTLTYEVSAGEHFIDIKYGKDQATDSGNDSLQWKVLSIEATSAGGDYTYTLTNVTDKHSLIFVFGEVTYYFVTSTGTACKLFPDGQQVKLPGDNYKLNIVPDDITYTVTITDNNIDRTNLLEREDGVDKNNNAVVSYSYSLSNIQATHNLVITCVPSNILYIKQNGSWIEVTHVYLKIDGRWVEQDITYFTDNNITSIHPV